MKFPKDEELFRNIPTGRNRWTNNFGHTLDSGKENEESVRAAYNRCYEEAAGKTLAAHKGYIRDDGYQRSEINKDFDQIAYALDRALRAHMDKTNGYIGEFPESRKYYATVGNQAVGKEHYYFEYLGYHKYEMTYQLRYYVRDLNALVYEEHFERSATKNAFALVAAVASIALMWFCRGWFFTYEGLGMAKIAALTLVFVGLLALLWQASDDPDKFALDTFDDGSPAGYLCGGLIVAVLVRIFLSGATAAKVCCVLAGLFGLSFLGGFLEAKKRLRQIRSRSPELRKLSSNFCKWFEEEALRVYRMLRFLELWHESEGNEAHKKNPDLENLRRTLMECVEEYEQWCHKYLRDSEDTGF